MAKLIGRYFFLTGFLAGAAFFFAGIELFSLGLDFAVVVPGFFVAGIGCPPLRSLLLGERRKQDGPYWLIGLRHYRNTLWRIQELWTVFIKKF
jgi:hypothetical protein